MPVGAEAVDVDAERQPGAGGGDIADDMDAERAVCMPVRVVVVVGVVSCSDWAGAVAQRVEVMVWLDWQTVEDPFRLVAQTRYRAAPNAVYSSSTRVSFVSRRGHIERTSASGDKHPVCGSRALTTPCTKSSFSVGPSSSRLYAPRYSFRRLSGSVRRRSTGAEVTGSSAF